MRARRSELEQFSNCQKAWQFGSVFGVQKKEKDDKLYLGSLVHKGLESFYKGNGLEGAITEMRKMAEGYEIEERDILDLAVGMIEHYASFAGETDDFEIIDVELPLEARLGKSWIRLTGRADAIIKRNGEVWLMEHKTASSLDTEKLILDRQVTLYLWLYWKQTGVKPAGVLYNILLKKLPRRPQLLKNGKLSKANIVTTANVYEQAVKEHGLNVEDYQDKITELAGQGYDRFFWREEVRRSEYELETVANEAHLIYKDMITRKHFYRNPKRECAYFCPFYSLCIAEITGADWIEIAKNGYYETGKQSELGKYWCKKNKFDAEALFQDKEIVLVDDEDNQIKEV